MTLDIPALRALCAAATDDASHWPINWSTEMDVHEETDDLGDVHTFECYRCWATDSRKDGSTYEMTLGGGGDYDLALGEYIARMNKREPTIAAALSVAVDRIEALQAALGEALDGWEARDAGDDDRSRRAELWKLVTP